MQWLTAILAFATTMLVFAIIVSTIVETIHRILGSRTYGLVMMLEQFYIEVLDPYIVDGGSDTEKNDLEEKELFVQEMIMVRGAAVPTNSNNTSGKFGKLISKILGFIPAVARYLYASISNTSDLARKLNKSQWQLLSDLPVVTFMERLGGTGFSDSLPDLENDKSKREMVLKDIAQKYEIYGQESALYFERKARTISICIAFIVGWIFYVHPQDLIQTYLKSPDVAAKVAEMSDDTQKDYKEIEKRLQELSTSAAQGSAKLTVEQLDELKKEIKKNLEDGRKKTRLLVDAGAPIGWPEDSGTYCLYSEIFKIDLFVTTMKLPKNIKSDSSCDEHFFTINTTKNPVDTFWLLMGGLLIGLGAPFWMKAIGQIKQTQGALDSVTKILKPSHAPQQGADKVNINVAGKPYDQPVTSEAFEVANAARAETS